jgi:peptidyl-prolyl cis-trans isomerase NIMA-interacting 4
MAGKKGKSDAKSQANRGEAKAVKGKGKQDAGQAPAKKKGAQSISARHILCEKHSHREEALAELRKGKDWKDVCMKYSIEKARSGMR